MKQIICEMCESTEFVKEEGMFICQGCGMRYSVEEAKKLMVEVEGVVPKADNTRKTANSEELDSLYQLARRAKDSDNSENAAKYYDMILIKDPNSWEANFYSVYFKAMCCTIGGIEAALESVKNCIDDTFNLIYEYVKDDEQRIAAVREVVQQTEDIANFMDKAYQNHYVQIDSSIRNNYSGERISVHLKSLATKNQLYLNLIYSYADDEALMVNFGHEALRRFLANDNNFFMKKDSWAHTGDAEALIARYDRIIAENKRRQEEEARRAQEEKNNKYWEAHAEEKKALEDEQAALESRITTLENEITFADQRIKNLRTSLTELLPAEKAAKEQQSLIDNLNAQRNALGIFKGKEKKAIQARIDEEESPKLTALRNEATAARKVHQAAISEQIATLDNESKPLREEKKNIQKRMEEIRNELTKDR